jgi:pilus assembly protein CpaE
MKARILVIEDDAATAKLIGTILNKAGYQVRIAYDGPSALQIAILWEPELILSDINLPGMTGYEISREMRRLDATRHSPIIMLTAASTISAKAMAFEAGADDYLTKPFLAPELVMRVKAHLRRADMVDGDDAGPAGVVSTFFSLRGGAGCTSLAVNLAMALNQLWDTSVALVDLALPVALCDVMLNLKPYHGLSDLAHLDQNELEGDVIEGHLTEHESGVKLLSGISTPPDADRITDSLVSHILDYLKTNYDYVVVDTSHSFSPSALAALDSADHILMPLTPDFNSLRVGSTALDVFDMLEYDTDKISIIINQFTSNTSLSKDRIERALKRSIWQAIPYARNLWIEGINTGQPVVLSDPDLPTVAGLEDMAWAISTPADRRSRPVDASPMWARVNARAEMRARRK